MCRYYEEKIFDLKIFNLLNNKSELIKTSATLLPFLKIDLIIGLPDILQYELVSKLLVSRGVRPERKIELCKEVGLKRSRCVATHSDCSCCVQPIHSCNTKRPCGEVSIAPNASTTRPDEVDVLDELIREITAQCESMEICNTVQACNQRCAPHLLSEVGGDCALCALIVDKSVLLGEPDDDDLEIDVPDSLDFEYLTATAVSSGLIANYRLPKIFSDRFRCKRES